jgi:asparagine synthase (glutamine-hydrolysing)
LRKDGYDLATNCDTESILASYLTNGVKCVETFNGMFSIAIHDQRSQELYLFRDRVGVKPLYYYYDGKDFIFCSEIKPILNCLQHAKPNPAAFFSYLKFNYVLGPQTIYENIHQVKPGHYLKFDSNGLHEIQYWDLNETTEEHPAYTDDLIERNHELLQSSIQLRNRSDVPVGAFLSGGIDSSLICALYAKHLNTDLSTFTIEFDDEDLDESGIALSLASSLGIENRAVPFEDAVEQEWKTILFHLDQPHGDTSFIPTSVLCREYSKHMKVALTGDGGDEIFCGYERYGDYFSSASTAGVLDSYLKTVSVFQDQEIQSLLVDEAYESHRSVYRLLNDFFENNSFRCPLNRLLYLDLKTILPDNNLIKPDRMGMMHSVESRNPLIDYRLIELNFKIRKSYPGFTLKYPLKKMLYDNIGPGIIPESKKTFSVPYKLLLAKVLKPNAIIEQFNRVYPILSGILDYDKTVRKINEMNGGSEIRKLRNLMGLFYWSEASMLS